MHERASIVVMGLLQLSGRGRRDGSVAGRLVVRVVRLGGDVGVGVGVVGWVTRRLFRVMEVRVGVWVGCDMSCDGGVNLGY